MHVYRFSSVVAINNQCSCNTRSKSTKSLKTESDGKIQHFVDKLILHQKPKIGLLKEHIIKVIFMENVQLGLR